MKMNIKTNIFTKMNTRKICDIDCIWLKLGFQFECNIL